MSSFYTYYKFLCAFIVATACSIFASYIFNSYVQYKYYFIASKNSPEIKFKEHTLNDKKNNSNLSLSSLKIISERDLFGTNILPSPETKTQIDIKNIPLAKKNINIRLLGTIISSDSKNIAVIEDKKNKKTGLYKVGDSVGNSLIKDIYRENIVVIFNGQDTLLTMVPDEIRDNEIDSAKIEPALAAANIIRRSEIEEKMKNMSQLMREAHIAPYFSEGQAKGFRISKIKEGSFFSDLNIKNGDIITEIGGQALDNPRNFFSLYDDLDSKSRVGMKIIRNGKEEVVEYEIQ